MTATALACRSDWLQHAPLSLMLVNQLGWVARARSRVSQSLTNENARTVFSRAGLCGGGVDAGVFVGGDELDDIGIEFSGPRHVTQ